MIRRFNYTKRRRIEREELTVKIHLGGTPTLDFSISDRELSEYPAHARVYIEVYKGPKVERIEIGVAGDRPLRLVAKPLTRFFRGEQPKLRVKVVDERKSMRPILGWADKVPPRVRGEDGILRQSILPVEPTDLGHEVWRLEFENDEDPVLLVNSRMLMQRDIVSIVQHDPEFSALVFPDCLRSILKKKFLHGESIDEDDDWYKFAVSFDTSIDPETDDEEKRVEWIEKVVSAFAEKSMVTQRYREYKEGRK